MKIYKYWQSFLVAFIFLGSSTFAYSQETQSDPEKYSYMNDVFNNLELTTNTNQKIKLSQVESPIVIINFWASWCPPCLEELPSLVKLRNEYNDNQLKIIAINIDEEKDQAKMIKKIQNKFNINFDIIKDKDTKIFDLFKMESVPLSLFFQNKKILKVENGKCDFQSSEIKKMFTHKS